MLIPIIRTSGTIQRTFIRTVAPTGTTLVTSSRLRPINCHTAPPKFCALYGIRNAERILGPTILHYVMNRSVSSLGAAKLAETRHLLMPMREHFGSVINSMQPEFLKSGLMKIHEDESSVIFTNGTLQLRIVTENRKHPSETGYIIDKNGVSHCIRTMQMIFNPTASDNEAADLKAIWDKFGLSNQDIPQTDRADGIREYLMLSFRHMIDFLETHKKSLSDFNYEL